MISLQQSMGTGTARAIYDRLVRDREPFLRRARDASRITIPHLMPEHAQYGVAADLPDAYQSLGARGLNNISARLLLALFPVNTKFMRLRVDKAAVVQNELFDRERAEIEESLSKIEDMVLEELETSGIRQKIHESLRQVVCTGNALLHVPQNRTPRVFRLDSYCVERDPRGNVITIVTHQRVAYEALNARVQAKIRAKGMVPDGMTAGSSGFFEIFTLVQRQANGSWKEFQEVNGQMLTSPTTHPAERLPYIPLRMYTTDGESYGRGHVEEYMGDLKALEGLRQSIVDLALAASKTLPMVDPDGVTRIKSLRDAKNGQFVSGKADDVSFLSLEKGNDLRFVSSEIESLKRELGLVFLLNSTVQRNAERVTAEEIRLVAQELEDTLGGTFSLLSSDLQMPLVRLIIGRLEERGAFPKLPDLVKPVIVTGLDAIGRGHDLAKMKELFETMLSTFGPEAMRSVNMTNAWKMAATALGVDTESLLKSPQQLQQEQQQAMAQAGIEKLGPEAMRQFPDEIRQAMGGGGDQAA